MFDNSNSENSKYTLTLNAPIATKVVCFSRLLKCFRSLYGKQCGPRSDCSYRLFASILNSSVMLGNYLQQTTSADDISDTFFLGALRVKCEYRRPLKVVLQSVEYAGRREWQSFTGHECSWR